MREWIGRCLIRSSDRKVGQKYNKNQCLSRIRKVVILWDKMPLSKALAMSLQTAHRGGILPPRCFLFFCPLLAFNKRETRFWSVRFWYFELKIMNGKIEDVTKEERNHKTRAWFSLVFTCPFTNFFLYLSSDFLEKSLLVWYNVRYKSKDSGDLCTTIPDSTKSWKKRD